MTTNRITIKRDGDKAVITSNDANIKQVFFGWADGGPNSALYGRQTKGDGSSGPDNSMWLWTLSHDLVSHMIDNLTTCDGREKADTDVLRALQVFFNETDAEAYGLDEFTAAYITAALWSTNDESTPDGGEPLDANYGPDDIAPETMAKIKADCAQFQEEHKELLSKAYELYEPRDGYHGPALAGHDLWLTSARHGCGFWDRGIGDVGKALTDAAHEFGERDIYVDDDGLIHGF